MTDEQFYAKADALRERVKTAARKMSAAEFEAAHKAACASEEAALARYRRQRTQQNKEAHGLEGTVMSAFEDVREEQAKAEQALPEAERDELSQARWLEAFLNSDREG